MDISDDIIETKKCFKCSHQLFENLNVAYNTSSSMVFLWNKYQILAYENLNFDNSTLSIVPEFLIQQLIVSNNYLVCLDYSGNIYVICLKLKHSAQKRLKSSFQPCQQGVTCFTPYNQEYILVVKLVSENIFLNLHKLSVDFQLCRTTILKCDEDWPLHHLNEEKCIIASQQLAKEDYNDIKDLFSIKENVWKDYSIILMSFDKSTVYSCLYSHKTTDEDIVLLKLYTCPSEICNIEIILKNGVNILIGLKSGTLIKLSLKDSSKAPLITHLNTALHKFVTSNDTIFYTDGVTMWKTENTFSHCDIRFSQFFLGHVKDFIKFGDQLVCTTFSNLIYMFSIDDEMVYLKPESLEEYCSAEKLLNNSEYLYKIMEEVEKNKLLIKRVNEEGNYIMALALSNRQDIMDSIINCNTIVYDEYGDVLNNYHDLILPHTLEQYFDTESFVILLEIIISDTQHMLSSILSSLLDNLKIHVTLSSENRILKTSSIKVTEVLKRINILIPLNRKDMLDATKINVHLKIVSNLPGAFDEKQKIWTVLYRKDIVLGSEHFVKSNLVTTKNICYKDSSETIENLICQAANHHHGHLFKFTDILKHKANAKDWSIYLKLPENFKNILRSRDNLKYFAQKKSSFLVQQYTAEEFLNSKSNLCFEIGKDKVEIEIIQEFSLSVMKVTCKNMRIAFNIRNFFSDLIYEDYGTYGHGKEYVTYAFYTTVENFRKALKDCVVNGLNLHDFLQISEQFQRTIFAALPL